MRLRFRDAFPVEVGHLLDQVVILQQDRPIRTDGQRMVITGHRNPSVGGRRLGPLVTLLVVHAASLGPRALDPAANDEPCFPQIATR
jgi:hypothetical protein